MLSESSMLHCSHDTEQIMPFRKVPEQEVTSTNEPPSLLNLSSLLLLFLPFCLLHPFFSSVKANKDESFSGAWWEIIRLPKCFNNIWLGSTWFQSFAHWFADAAASGLLERFSTRVCNWRHLLLFNHKSINMIHPWRRAEKVWLMISGRRCWTGWICAGWPSSPSQNCSFSYTIVFKNIVWTTEVNYNLNIIFKTGLI